MIPNGGGRGCATQKDGRALFGAKHTFERGR
jgi:hypothetical protein